MNYFKILIACLFILSVATLKLSSHQQLKSQGGDTRVGGYQELDINRLPEDAQKVDAFLRAKHDGFENGKLVSASRQVVAGMNYRMIYTSAKGSRKWDIIVFKSLKGELFENGYTMTETLQNGQTVKAIADPSSAFGGPYRQTPKVTAVASVRPKAVDSSYKQIDRTTIPNSIAPKILGSQ